MIFSGEDYFPSSRHSILPSSSLYRLQALCFIPHPFWHMSSCCPCSDIFGLSYLWDFTDEVSNITWRQNLKASCLLFCSYHLPAPYCLLYSISHPYSARQVSDTHYVRYITHTTHTHMTWEFEGEFEWKELQEVSMWLSIWLKFTTYIQKIFMRSLVLCR